MCIRDRDRWVAESVARYQHPDPDLLSPRREASEQRPCLEVRSLRAAGLHEVIAKPGALEAKPLEQLPALDVLLPSHVLVGTDAESESTSHSPPPLRVCGRRHRIVNARRSRGEACSPRLLRVTSLRAASAWTATKSLCSWKARAISSEGSSSLQSAPSPATAGNSPPGRRPERVR